jgi:UDP-N-acetylglucosamine:LPS N-acetylglucosamine transferase
MPQDEMTPESVARLVKYPREDLLKMAERVRALARPEAAAALARACEEMVKV